MTDPARRAGVIPSPNIWNTPQLYEIENRAVDPDGVIAAAMLQVRDWAGATVLDVGCGTGYHLPWFAQTAERVIGVEPHPKLVDLARRRVAALSSPARERISVLAGTASDVPLPDASVDVAHARWAYFFGAGCEPGLVELTRVMRRGGVAFVIDNDATRSTFGDWFRRFLPRYDPLAVERFWAQHGFTRVPLTMRWLFTDRADLAAVLGIEFPPDLAAAALAEVPGLEVDYAVNLFWRSY